MITALCGGVGGSKLALGLYLESSPGDLSLVVNTADDLTFAGLHVSPDLDTVCYTLAGLAPTDVGWGIAGDTFHSLSMLETFGVPTWFRIGDRDLATHVFRTSQLQAGLSLTQVTETVTERFGVTASILPMTDDDVATELLVQGEWLGFQEYFVKRRHSDDVDAIRYLGLEAASTSAATLRAIDTADAIILVNSNPVLSILPILGVQDVNARVASSQAPRVAVSPVVGNDAVTGPAAKLLCLIEQPSSVVGVAGAYLGVIDGIVIDRQDRNRAAEIEAMGLAVLCTDTIMRTVEDRRRLARETLKFALSLR